MTYPSILASCVLALGAVAGGCTTTALAPVTSTASRPMVSRIDLSQTTGQVGEEFEADVVLHSQRLGPSEVKVQSLPPGLRFDAETRTIAGVPEADGFFSVTVAVRKKRGAGVHFSTPHGAWFSERLSIDIFRPIDEKGEREAWQDRGIARADP